MTDTPRTENTRDPEDPRDPEHLTDPRPPEPFQAPPLDRADWPNHLARPGAPTLLKGGWVGSTWRVRLTDGTDAVVKQTPYPADAEVDGLAALAAAGVPVPPVLGHAGTTLVLAFVEGPADWAGLGRAVAGMHQVTHHAFGWHRDNQAGRFRQPNGWRDDWPTFFVENRVLTHLADPIVPREFATRLERACDGPIQALLPERPAPALTHGDLWTGNTVSGRWIIDPEVSFADRELDLACMHMAGDSFPQEFFDAYAEVLPIPDGYEDRRAILEIHHRLLQVRHFGASALATLDAVLAHYGW